MSITLESLKDEQDSMTHSEWVQFFVPGKIEIVKDLLRNKKQRLEHCINFIMDDTIHTDGKRIWILSKGKESHSIDEKSDLEQIKLIHSFYLCVQDKEKLPSEISELEDTLAYLYAYTD